MKDLIKPSTTKLQKTFKEKKQTSTKKLNSCFYFFISKDFMCLWGLCYSVPSELAMEKHIYDALRDLVPFVQFKKREKHPWRSVAFNAGFSLQLY